MVKVRSIARCTAALAACAALRFVFEAPIVGAATRLTYLAPEHVGVGRDTELILVTSGTDPVRRVQITPSDGITIGDVVRGIETAGEESRGWTRWTTSIAVDASAGLGRRQVAVTTAAGRAGSQKLEIVSHVPEIADLMVINAKSIGAIVEFQFTATDPENDLGDRPKVVYAEGDESRSGFPSVVKVTAFDAIDPTHFRVQAKAGGHNLLTIGFPGTRPMTVFVEDKTGHKSNKLQGEYTW